MRSAAKLLIFIFVFPFVSHSQDSTQTVFPWQVSSKKIADNKYEISFKTRVEDNWQVYAPNQVLLDLKTVELKFADSSILEEGPFKIGGDVKEITNSIFEGQQVKVQEESIEWSAIISIPGTVPSKLQGSLFFTYGKNDEYYPSTEFPFVTELEGGVQATRIKIPSIDINNPVNNCGDEGTKNKSILTIFLLGLLGVLIALLTP
jgi:hypothetical protein